MKFTSQLGSDKKQINLSAPYRNKANHNQKPKKTTFEVAGVAEC